MSMTKMVATTAALQLVERGELDLQTPVEELVPQWGELQVLDGFDGDTPRLRPPASQATVSSLPLRSERRVLCNTASGVFRLWVRSESVVR